MLPYVAIFIVTPWLHFVMAVDMVAVGAAAVSAVTIGEHIRRLLF